MIRPVSELQMQRSGASQLHLSTSPRKSTLNSLSLSPSKTPPKSPIKKHLQSSWASDVASASAVASIASSDDLDLDAGPMRATLRASVLQAVLRLLDQDTRALAGAREVLQVASTLPLAEPDVQRACVQALRELQNPMPPSFVYSSGESVSNENWSATEASATSSEPHLSMEKRSGRVKRQGELGSLHHCKEFLLACANEIHELEDVYPAAFDYAEDTSSSMDLPPSKRPLVCQHCTAAFDYASTVPESSFSSLDDEDDVRADQGSQFSEILHRAEYMSETSDQFSETEFEIARPLLTTRGRSLCRQVLRALQQNVQTQTRRGNAPSLAVKFRAFQALKREATLKRKRVAFQHLKTRLLSQRNLLGSGKYPAKTTTSIRALTRVIVSHALLRNADVLLLLLALVFLANLPTQYIL
ncbi:hypothetical protein BBJ28_00000912 [Nothophytophthora sp. Chile5]|nr:hypothetical protein BBJ28_00000912 [Nothophytophthora sp. Chile5]